MTSPKLDKAIEDYLKRLRREAAVLPTDRREELLTEIRAHAESAVSEGESPDEVVAHLGDPRAVVAEARSESNVEGEFTGTDVAVILLLALTLLLPVFAWAAAALKITSSASWATKQKVIGVILLPWAGYALTVLLRGGLHLEYATGPFTWLYWATMPLGILSWTGAVYLYRAHPARIARQRAKAEGSRLHRALGDSFTLRR